MKRLAGFTACQLTILLLSACQSEGERPAEVVRIDTRIVENVTNAQNIYVVRPGDTLYSIAWAHELDYRALARWNRLRPPYLLRNGQQLRLSPPSPGPHTTRKSDTQEVMAKNAVRSNQRSTGDTSHAKKQPLPKHQHRSETKKPGILASHGKKIKKKSKKSVTNWRWPVKGTIIGRFSPRRGGNKGIDILTPGPSPVVAVADGRVVYSGSGLRGYGKLIIIKHDENWLTAYAYNARLRVKDKEFVKVGQIIADTGYEGLYANQLHFEVRYQGKPVDPLKYLPQKQ